MKKVVYKWFWAWDFEKEEKWLNDMCKKGLKLSEVGLCRYAFEECEAGEYQYKLEMLENAVTTKKSKEYISFLKDTKIEYVGSVFRWAYLRKKTSQGQFELFSNIDSQITHLNRILSLFLAFLGMEVAIGSRDIVNFLETIKKRNASIDMSISSLVFVVIYMLFGIGIYKILRKRKKLKNERRIYE